MNPKTIADMKSHLQKLIDLQKDIAAQSEMIQPVLDQITMWEKISKPEYLNSDKCLSEFAKSKKMINFKKTADVIKSKLINQLDTIQKINLV
jgi:hypothetical protein